MDRVTFARRTDMIAKQFVAEYKYKYDPSHKKIPCGGGWKETHKGWSKNDDNSTHKMNSKVPNAKSTNDVLPEHYGDVDAPIRRKIRELRKNFFSGFSVSLQRMLMYNLHVYKEKDYPVREKIINKLKDTQWWDKATSEDRQYHFWKELSHDPQHIANQQELHYFNLVDLGEPLKPIGIFWIAPLNSNDEKVYGCIYMAVDAVESLVDKDMVPDYELSFKNYETENGNGRSYYTNFSKCITLYDEAQYDISTIAHEMGHFIEYNTPGVKKICKEFLDARTVGEEPQKLKKLTNLKYQDNEYCRPDKFFDPYCGKIYPDGSTEILSMGIQVMAENPLLFNKQDPEYFVFIRGILRGAFKNYNKENYE